MTTISRTVWILSLISLLTDTASEMLYPVMPIYLKSIGFSIVLIGVLEGFAEATAGLTKGYFGKRSDVSGRRAPFILGYALSSISKPMMALLTAPLWTFFSRTIDRLGKGIRTGARDAMLSDEATPGNKGKVFGFHRSMDTFGELQRIHSGIPAKTLSKELKDLVTNGLVKRTVLDTMPVTVQYAITPYGRTLEAVLLQLHGWGVKHREYTRNGGVEKKVVRKAGKPARLEVVG